MRKLFLVACAGLFLSGCASRNLLRVDGAGPPIENPKVTEAVNLAIALNPAGLPATGQAADCLRDAALCGAPSLGGLSAKHLLTLIGFDEANSASSRNQRLIQERMKLEAALAAFYDARNNAYGDPEDRRNRLQSRLIGASEANCKTFAQTVYGVQASTNFVFGGLTTTLSGAGAITTNQQTARLLSGLAGISSGLRSEANEDFFRKQWIEAVIKAIDSSRDRMKLDMESRWNQSINEYPVEAAIADAIEFNGECSVVAGMKQVNSAVAIADDPAGAKAMRNAFRQAGLDVGFDVQKRRDDAPESFVDSPAVPLGAKSKARRTPGAQAANAIVALDTTAQKVRGQIPALVIQAQAKYKAEKKSEMPQAMVSALQGSLDAIAANLINAAGSNLQPYFADLGVYAAKGATLSSELANITDPDARSDKLAQIRANDAKAAADLALALHLVASIDKALHAKAGLS